MRIQRGIAGLAGMLCLALTGTADAVPCGSYALVGGVDPSTACQNGPSGDANASVADLNNGSGFFSIKGWSELDKTDNGVDTNYWTFTGQGDPSGTFTLASDIWSSFSHLLVVLKDGGSTTNSNIKWSAYLLPQNVLGPYSWSYDQRKEISYGGLYGVQGGTTTVPEPASAALALLGIGMASIALRRRRSTRS